MAWKGKDKESLMEQYKKDVDEAILSVASRVAEKLIEDNKKGLKPWESSVFTTEFKNPASGTVYNLENAAFLYFSTVDSGYNSPKFITAKQGFDAGLTMEKGTKGHKIIQRFGMKFGYLPERNPDGSIRKDNEGRAVLKRDDEGNLIPIYKRCAKMVSVFNLDQFKGDIPKAWLEVEQKKVLSNEDVLLKVMKVLEDNGNVEIKRHSKEALFLLGAKKDPVNFYSHSKDSIYLAPSDNFKNTLREISTGLHELAHSTGHKTRLNRECAERYHEEKYYRGVEELVANFSARVLCQELGLDNNEVSDAFDQNHDAYDASWMMRVIEKDPRGIFEAADMAQRAKNMVTNWIGDKLRLIPEVNEVMKKKKSEQEVNDGDNEQDNQQEVNKNESKSKPRTKKYK